MKIETPKQASIWISEGLLYIHSHYIRWEGKISTCFSVMYNRIPLVLP